MSQTKAQLISDLVQALNFTGTSSAPANGVYLSAANELKLATASSERLMINGDGLTVQKGVTVNGIEGGDAQIRLRADEGDDNNDMYRLVVEDGGTGFKIQGYDGSFQTRLIIDSTGKVGIGTTSPDALLHLSAISPFIRFTDTADSSHYAHIGHSDSSIFYIDADAANAHAGSGIQFKVDNSNVMFLKDGGNVGIGTTSPTETLHIYQSAVDNVNVLLEQGNTNSGNLIQFKQTTTGSVTRTAYIGHGGDATGQLMIQNSGNIYLQTGGSSTALTIDATQNSTFEGWVHLKDNKALYIGSSNDLSLFHDATDCRIRYNHTVGSLKFQKNDNSDVMVLDANGKLLIGTTQTASKLTVDTDFCVIRASSDPTINLLLGTTASITKLYRILIDDSDSDKLQIRDDDTARITMNGSGQVGIGTTSPAEKLQVHGAIRSSANSADWGAGSEGFFADYYAAGNMVRLGHVNGASGSAKHIRFYSGGVSQFELNTSGATIARRGVNFPNPNNTGAEITAAILKLGSDNLQLQERYPDGAYADRCDLVIRTNSGYGGGQSDKVRFRAGGGICFGTDTASANALDDYEEGTFTPYWSNGLTGSGYSYQHGIYTKVGRQVSWTIILYISSGNDTTTGNAVDIAGFPFTCLNSSPYQSGGGYPFYQDYFYNSANSFAGIQIDNNTIMRLYKGNNGTYLVGSDVDGDRQVRMTGFYFVP